MIEVNLPDNGAQPGAPECFPGGIYEAREWMRRALYAAGAVYGGGSGVGCGGADIDVVIEGHRFNVQIKPLPDVFCAHGMNRYTASCPDCRREESGLRLVEASPTVSEGTKGG